MTISGVPVPPGAVAVRPATSADLSGMAAIYNDAVARTVATFDLEPRPDDHYADAVASTRPGDHAFVAHAAGSVLGFAYAGTYRPRRAYDGTREISVYLAPQARGLGAGRALYDHLLDRVDADGIHTCLAVIAQPNPASEALHRSVGFVQVGVLREVGRKFGQWVDTGLWQRMSPTCR
ncbi:MAG: GNAT family N-acetyltransferase [Dermatophilaceae bacterium]